MSLSPVAVYLFLFLLFPFLVGLFIYIYSCLKVELVEGGTFWLSESPSVAGSISWGAVAPCIVTWAISSILLSFLGIHQLLSSYIA